MNYKQKYLKYKQKYNNLKRITNEDSEYHKPNYYFYFNEDETIKPLMERPIDLKFCSIVQTKIYKNNGDDIGTLGLEVDLMYKFISDIANNKLDSLNEIKELANCIINTNNTASSRDIWSYA